MATLVLRGDSMLSAPFFPVLQAGFWVQARVGIPLQQLLIEDFGIEPGYLENRLQTLFLNGRPVDAPSQAVIETDAVIALSAALPGLVGATMRRAGRYASMRESISAAAVQGDRAACPGKVMVKLFNVTAQELGPLFLRRGLLYRGDELHRFLLDQPEAFWKGCVFAMHDNLAIVPEKESVLRAIDVSKTMVVCIEQQGVIPAQL